VPTLILPPRYTTASIALWKAGLQLGWNVERLQNWRSPLELQDQDPVVYGEALFVAAIADQLSLALLETPFDWLTHLPYCYRRRKITYSTLAEARALTEPAFVKPVTDKCFAAKVYPTGIALPGADLFHDDTPVLIADPVEWIAEFRCFILERQVVASSPYLRGGESAQELDDSWPFLTDEQDHIIAFVEDLLSDPEFRLPPAIVLDVGLIADRGWAIVEANPVWASGLCGCDPVAVLPAIQRACIRQELLTDADSHWIVVPIVA
jgi:hypothetical protein